MGCDPRFFKASGYVASEGGLLGGWRAVPDACSRFPFDGQAIGESSSIATFVWEDPGMHDPMRDRHRAKAPDQPARLELSRQGQGFRVDLATVKARSAHFVSSDCVELSVRTWEEAPAVPGVRGSLAGQLRMDCRVEGSHVTAALSFRRCEF